MERGGEKGKTRVPSHNVQPSQCLLPALHLALRHPCPQLVRGLHHELDLLELEVADALVGALGLALEVRQHLHHHGAIRRGQGARPVNLVLHEDPPPPLGVHPGLPVGQRVPERDVVGDDLHDVPGLQVVVILNALVLRHGQLRRRPEHPAAGLPRAAQRPPPVQREPPRRAGALQRRRRKRERARPQDLQGYEQAGKEHTHGVHGAPRS
mmetsp:Transcript_32895/g.104154  ORF Transcript_32895/g.104154 Transcript_32895/m.104154 type:complete len:210 (-) Transcript_32895:274-903(-)